MRSKPINSFKGFCDIALFLFHEEPIFFFVLSSVIQGNRFCTVLLMVVTWLVSLALVRHTCLRLTGDQICQAGVGVMYENILTWQFWTLNSETHVVDSFFRRR